MSSRDPRVRLPSWLIAASLVVVVVATLTYFVTSNNDNTDEAAPPSPAGATVDDTDSDQPPEEPEQDPASKQADTPDSADKKADDRLPTKKPEKAPEKKPAKTPDPEPEPDAVVDVYNNSGITNLAASVSSDVRGAGFTIGGVDNWYGSIPESTVYYPRGMEEQASLLADDLGVARTMPAIAPMSTERLSLILTAAI